MILFDPPLESPYSSGLPGHHGQDTEIEAATVANETASHLRARVRELLVARGPRGLTYIEAQEIIGIASAQQRLSDLVRCGLAVDSGMRRPTPRGCSAKVYITADLARGRVG